MEKNRGKRSLPLRFPGNFGDLHVEWNENPGPRTTFEETFGRAILFTNQDTWAPEDVIWGYREQTMIEYAFRSMKDPHTIAIRPTFLPIRNALKRTSSRVS